MEGLGHHYRNRSQSDPIPLVEMGSKLRSWTIRESPQPFPEGRSSEEANLGRHPLRLFLVESGFSLFVQQSTLRYGTLQWSPHMGEKDISGPSWVVNGERRKCKNAKNASPLKEPPKSRLMGRWANGRTCGYNYAYNNASVRVIGIHEEKQENHQECARRSYSVSFTLLFHVVYDPP